MNFSYFTAQRLSLGKRSFSAFIIRMGIAAVAISVAVMILAVGIMQGYKTKITEKITGFNAHLQIKSLDFNESFEAKPILSDEAYLQELKAAEGVHNVQAYAQKAGIIKTADDIEGIVLKGVGAEYDWSFLTEGLKSGRELKQKDSLRNEIFISQYTANKLRLKTGDKINIFFLQDQSQPVRVRRLEICGIFETGLDDYDKTFGLVDIRHIQKLYGWGETQVEGFEVRLKNFDELEMRAEQLKKIVPLELDVKTAHELKPQIFDWLALLDTNVLIILVLMVVVAAINIVTSLLILILERTNMIGILKALGSSDRQIRSIFLWKAAYLTGIGLLLGNLFGLGLGFLQAYTGLFQLDPASYYLSAVPFEAGWVWLLAVNTGSFLLCLLALLIPVRMVGRISPVKAIRFE